MELVVELNELAFHFSLQSNLVQTLDEVWCLASTKTKCEILALCLPLCRRRPLEPYKGAITYLSVFHSWDSQSRLAFSNEPVASSLYPLKIEAISLVSSEGKNVDGQQKAVLITDFEVLSCFIPKKTTTLTFTTWVYWILSSFVAQYLSSLLHFLQSSKPLVTTTCTRGNVGRQMICVFLPMSYNN